MSWDLTAAEKIAIEAQSLPSFPINVEKIRRTVSALLSQFGRNGKFDEYTVHDFGHVHEMLKCLDWLVPADTRALLTKSDWLLLTLSCYFHDLGLLVTRDEFESRGQSSFQSFCESILFTGPDGPDYRAKVYALRPNREKDFYIRSSFDTTMQGVRDWIVGKPNVALGQAQAAAACNKRNAGKHYCAICFRANKQRFISLPQGQFVANADSGSMGLTMIFDQFEVRRIRGVEADRKLELHWRLREKEESWWSSTQIEQRMNRLNRRVTSVIHTHFEERMRLRRGRAVGYSKLMIPMLGIVFEGLERYAAVTAVGRIFFNLIFRS